MRQDAEASGLKITPETDQRIIGIGKWLRKYKIDELPQLLNVLKGDMSIVGPRPEVPQYVSHYNAQQMKVIDLMPGITDPASIRYRKEGEILAQAEDPEQLYLDVIMPEKLRLNLEYSERASFLNDMKVIAQTFLGIFADRSSRRSFLER
jgi:lipopolysaccharide/colanic/teichoic acid biosynthesis glycosyltransferase